MIARAFEFSLNYFPGGKPGKDIDQIVAEVARVYDGYCPTIEGGHAVVESWLGDFSVYKAAGWDEACEILHGILQVFLDGVADNYYPALSKGKKMAALTFRVVLRPLLSKGGISVKLKLTACTGTDSLDRDGGDEVEYQIVPLEGKESLA